MPSRTVQRDDRRGKTIVVIIILVWVIVTMRSGPDWLTPTELAFFALLLNPRMTGTRPIGD